MQFRDLQKQYEVLKPEMDAAMTAVASGAHFISGEQVKMLEERLAAYVGRKHCITCANGTDALELCMMAWGVGPGDAVFVPDFTFFASGEIVSSVGGTPVFYDVCADTFNADAKSLEAAIEAVVAEGKLTPKAVVDVDLFGLPADHDGFCVSGAGQRCRAEPAFRRGEVGRNAKACKGLLQLFCGKGDGVFVVVSGTVGAAVH